MHHKSYGAGTSGFSCSPSWVHHRELKSAIETAEEPRGYAPVPPHTTRPCPAASDRVMLQILLRIPPPCRAMSDNPRGSPRSILSRFPTVVSPTPPTACFVRSRQHNIPIPTAPNSHVRLFMPSSMPTLLMNKGQWRSSTVRDAPSQTRPGHPMPFKCHHPRLPIHAAGEKVNQFPSVSSRKTCRVESKTGSTPSPIFLSFCSAAHRSCTSRTAYTSLVQLRSTRGSPSPDSRSLPGGNASLP